MRYRTKKSADNSVGIIHGNIMYELAEMNSSGVSIKAQREHVLTYANKKGDGPFARDCRIAGQRVMMIIEATEREMAAKLPPANTGHREIHITGKELGRPRINVHGEARDGRITIIEDELSYMKGWTGHQVAVLCRQRGWEITAKEIEHDNA